MIGLEALDGVVDVRLRGVGVRMMSAVVRHTNHALVHVWILLSFSLDTEIELRVDLRVSLNNPIHSFEFPEQLCLFVHESFHLVIVVKSCWVFLDAAEGTVLH